MKSCPVCGSQRVHSNRFSDGSFEKVAHVGRWAQMRGNRFLALASAGAGAAMLTFNRFRQPLKCKNCGSQFPELLEGRPTNA